MKMQSKIWVYNCVGLMSIFLIVSVACSASTGASKMPTAELKNLPQQAAPKVKARTFEPKKIPSQAAPQKNSLKTTPKYSPQQAAPKAKARTFEPKKIPSQAAPQKKPRKTAPKYSPRQATPQKMQRVDTLDKRGSDSTSSTFSRIEEVDQTLIYEGSQVMDIKGSQGQAQEDVSKLDQMFGREDRSPGRSPESVKAWGTSPDRDSGHTGSGRPALIEERDFVKMPYQVEAETTETSPGKSFEGRSGDAIGTMSRGQTGNGGGLDASRQKSNEKRSSSTSGGSYRQTGETTESTKASEREAFEKASVREKYYIPNDVAQTADAKTLEDAAKAIIDSGGNPSESKWWGDYDAELSDITGVPQDMINKGDMSLKDLIERAGVIQSGDGDPSDPDWWKNFSGKMGESFGIPGDLIKEHSLEDLLNAKGVIMGVGADEGKIGVWEGALGVVNAGKEGAKGDLEDKLFNFNKQYGSLGQSLDEMLFGTEDGDGIGMGSGDGTGTGPDAGGTGGSGTDSGGASTGFPDLSASGTHQAGEQGMPGGSSPSGGQTSETPGTSTDPNTGSSSQDPNTQTVTGAPQSGEGDPNAGWSGTAEVTHNKDGSFTVTYTGYDENGEETGSYDETYTQQKDGTWASKEGGTSSDKPEEDTYPLSEPNADGVATADTSEDTDGSSSSDDTADSGSDDTADTGSDDTDDTGSDDTDDTGSDDTADTGSDDTDDTGSGSGDAATPDPEGGGRYFGPALTKEDMALMYKEYMESKGMDVNKSPTDLKENASKLGVVDRVAPYARPTDDSGGSEDFSGFSREQLSGPTPDTLIDPMEPELEGDVGNPNQPGGTGGEIPRN